MYMSLRIELVCVCMGMVCLVSDWLPCVHQYHSVQITPQLTYTVFYSDTFYIQEQNDCRIFYINVKMQNINSNNHCI